MISVWSENFNYPNTPLSKIGFITQRGLVIMKEKEKI